MEAKLSEACFPISDASVLHLLIKHNIHVHTAKDLHKNSETQDSEHMNHGVMMDRPDTRNANLN